MQKENKLTRNFIIGTFVTLYVMVSIISTIHVIDFFRISNPEWLAITLAIAFEVGAAASLASIIAMKKMNKGIVWALFITLTAMQAMGNTYFAYVHLVNYQSWVELFGLIDEEIITQKRILSMVSGAILPLVALGFIKSLVDYIKPDEGVNEGVNDGVNKAVNDQITDAVTQTLPIDITKEINENIPPYQPTQTDLQKFEELLKKYDKKFVSDNLTNTVVNNYEELPENIQENNVIDVIVEPIIEDLIIEDENIETETIDEPVIKDIIIEDENIETETIDEPVIKDIIIEDENVIGDIVEPTINDIIVEDGNIDEEVKEELTTSDNQEEVIEKKN
jgi:hypothetical protein